MSSLPRAGYGSQALALKYLGIEFEHWKICEWAVKSIQAYKDIHFTNDNNDYSNGFYKQKLQEMLLELGISSNYNEPMTKQQIDRLNEKQLRTIWNNIVATHNLVNIQQVKGKDLEITDTDKYDYILTYSFPCQDLSLAGKGKGMSDTSTRSGMLWEVERILSECYELGTMPQILLMENVPQVHGTDNIKDFNKWQSRLEELGYKSYVQDLIATDYGIPQTRNRCFMVSILGDYSYTFPKPIPLKLKLKDMLEDNADEKYYLSDKMIRYISANNQKWTGNNNEALVNKTNASTLNTNEGSRRCDASNYICDDVGENYNIKNGCKQIYDLNYYNHEQSNRVYSADYSNPTLRTKCDDAGTIKIEDNRKKAIGNKSLQETLENNEIKEEISYIDAYNRKIRDDNLSSTISTRVDASNNTYIAIKNATKKGYLEATDGDGIDISSRMEHHRGNVQKDKIQTITTTGGNDRGVVTLGNYSPSGHNASRIVDQEYSAPTVMENHGTVTATQTNELRIRKLSPRECWRLMGVKDEDFDKVKVNQSDSSLYHLAGDSIVVNVLMAIFKELLEIEEI